MQLDYDDIMHQAKGEATQQMYEANTEEAKQLGVFGAPSFSIGNEIFWGDDRLEELRKLIDAINRSVVPPVCSAAKRNPWFCLLYTSPSPRDMRRSRMPSSA